MHRVSAAVHQFSVDLSNRGELARLLNPVEQEPLIPQRDPQESKTVQDIPALRVGNDRDSALAFSRFLPRVQAKHGAGSLWQTSYASRRWKGGNSATLRD